jgi:transketolase
MDQSAVSIFGEIITALAQKNPKIVLLDTTNAANLDLQFFAQKFPDRFFKFEQAVENMIGVASGLAKTGQIPVVYGAAADILGKIYSYLRQDICVSAQNVKLFGIHCGLEADSQGSTGQFWEDLALARVLPQLKVFVPADAEETKQIINTVVVDQGPVYVRLFYPESNGFYTDQYQFVIGRASELVEGKNIVIFATGRMVARAMMAAEILRENTKYSAKVINISTINPIDKHAIIKWARLIKLVATVEDHSILGGLGSVVAEVLAENCPTKMIRIGVKDQVGPTREIDDVYEVYGLSAEGIFLQLQNFLNQ